MVGPRAGAELGLTSSPLHAEAAVRRITATPRADNGLRAMGTRDGNRRRLLSGAFRRASGAHDHAVHMGNHDLELAHGGSRRLLRPAFDLTVLIALATLAGTLVFAMQRTSGPSWVDEAARAVVPLHVHSGINRVMTWITDLGGEVILLSAFGALALWSHRAQGALWARFFMVVMVGALALDNVVKPLVGRPRPVLDQLVGGRGESFPSGHATATTAFLFAVAYYLTSGRSPRARALTWAAALLGSLLMGVTRVYLGVHWPTDVIAGMVLGGGWTMLCARSQHVSTGLAVTSRRPRRLAPRARLALTILAFGGFAR
jgi:membrane-associated phospholipid phosphatase